MSRDLSEYKIWEYDRPMPDLNQNVNDIYQVASPRIWAIYKIDDRASQILRTKCKSLHEDDAERLKARLASVLIDRISYGEINPAINSELITRLIDDPRPLPVAKRARRLLQFFTRPQFEINKPIDVVNNHEYREAVLGYSESISDEEIQYLSTYLLERGWIKKLPGTQGSFYATVEGYESLESEISSDDTPEVFVAMWFDERLDRLWTVIERTIIETGYEPVRVDMRHFGSLIDDEIVASIRRSKFVVADFTCDEKGDRGSVYYEAGFARGLDKEVIQTAQESVLKERRIAFDLDHYPIIPWTLENLDEFGKNLKDRIEALFGIGPSKQR